jgi:hypothetical protein
MLFYFFLFKGNLIDRDFNSVLSKLKKSSDYDENLVKSIYKNYLDELKSDYACNTFYDVSAKGLENYDDYDGEEYTNLKNGFIKLIQYLSSSLPANIIKLNEFVENIDWSAISNNNPNGLIKVRTSNTVTKAKSTFQSKFVVSSVSLGVLKSSYRSLFTPSLPNDKINAIQNLGFGTVNKIFLVFDGPVFSDDESGLRLLWRKDLDFTLNADKKCNLRVKFFFNFVVA